MVAVDSDIRATKHELRQLALKRRAATTRSQLAQRDRQIFKRLMALPPCVAPRAIFCFISVGHEPDTRALLETFKARGIAISVPKIITRHAMHAVPFPGWAALVLGPLGIPAPIASGAFDAPIDIVIVPGLAFSGAGYRLGYGAGFYDRWLAQHPQPLRIGICGEAELVADLPTEPHDLAVDIVVTDGRICVPPQSRYRGPAA